VRELSEVIVEVRFLFLFVVGQFGNGYERNMEKTAGLYAKKYMGRLRQALMGNARLVSGP
jgi:hypothetical protein